MRLTAFFLSFLTCTLAVAEVTIQNVWVRLLPPNIKTTSAYMDIQSDQNDILMSVSTPAALMVEMHESSMEEGMMSMERVPEIILPADQVIALKPQGMHLMVMGLHEPLKEGNTIPFTLTFQNAGEKKIDAVIESR